MLLFAAGFYTYFLYYTLDGLTSWFSPDDLMNLYGSLSRLVRDPARSELVSTPVSAWDLIRDNLQFWSGGQRPMGTAFYHMIYAVWGFNPTPFRVAALILVSLNLWLMFAVVRKMSGSLGTAIWAMFLTGLHASFVSIYYDTGVVYDILAFLFYYSALLYYLRLRESGKLPNPPQTLLLLGLFVAALNSKEIAVSLPFAFLLFEWFWFRPSDFRLRTLAAWLAGPGRAGLLMAAIDLLYVAGRVAGEQPVVNRPFYRPHLSLIVYLQNYSEYLSEMVWSHRALPAAAVLSLLCGIVLASILCRQRHLKWAAFMIVLAFLPLAFIPLRDGFAFYVPALPWALWAAGAAVVLRATLARGLWRCAGRLRAASGNPGVAFGLQLATQGALAGLIIFRVVPFHAWAFSYAVPAIHYYQNANRMYHDQILMLLPALPRSASVLVLNDPYPGESFNTVFLFCLTFGDLTMTVHQARVVQRHAATLEPTSYDAVLDFIDHQFVLRRGPPRPDSVY